MAMIDGLVAFKPYFRLNLPSDCILLSLRATSCSKSIDAGTDTGFTNEDTDTDGTTDIHVEPKPIYFIMADTIPIPICRYLASFFFKVRY